MSYLSFLHLVSKASNPLDGRSKLLLLNTSQAYHKPLLRRVSDGFGSVGVAQSQFGARWYSVRRPVSSAALDFPGWGFLRFYSKPAVEKAVSLEPKKACQVAKKKHVKPVAAVSKKSGGGDVEVVRRKMWKMWFKQVSLVWKPRVFPKVRNRHEEARASERTL